MYLHISAAGVFVAGGYWEMTSAQVDRLRRAVADDVAGPELVRTIDAARKKRLQVGGQEISRVPTGYPKDHPRGDLLRLKSLTASREIGCPPWLATPKAKTEIAKLWRTIAPLVTWLDTHVGGD